MVRTRGSNEWEDRRRERGRVEKAITSGENESKWLKRDARTNVEWEWMARTLGKKECGENEN